MFKKLLFASVFVLAASAVHAQGVTGTIATITNQTTLISTVTTLPPTAITCGQPKTSVVTNTNPGGLAWDDSTNPAFDCVYRDPGTGILLALPFGPTSYIVTLQATNSAGVSAPSAPSLPFTRPGQAPGAPTGARVVR